TFPYGVTLFGVIQQITEAYQEDHDWHEPRYAGYLAKLVLKTTKQILQRPDQAMECIRKLAAHQAAQNLPLKWVTPTGLPVISNRCYKPNVRPVELALKRRRVFLVADGRKDEINADEAMNDGPPNLTHSMDAAHLCRTANALVRRGITEFCMIHDCYGGL